MARADVSITLEPGPWDEPDLREFRLAGGEIRGQVHVDTDEDMNCRRVLVAIEWYTEGRGDLDQGTVFEQTVHEGFLQMGQQSFPFAATLPVGPMSYAGHYINIRWKVTARIDLAWKFDPKAEREFFLTLP